jgi:hypothetical protein
MIVPPFTKRYGKISTVVVFDAPRIFPEEEHRSRSACHSSDVSYE